MSRYSGQTGSGQRDSGKSNAGSLWADSRELLYKWLLQPKKRDEVAVQSSTKDTIVPSASSSLLDSSNEGDLEVDPEERPSLMHDPPHNIEIGLACEILIHCLSTNNIGDSTPRGGACSISVSGEDEDDGVIPLEDVSVMCLSTFNDSELSGMLEHFTTKSSVSRSFTSNENALDCKAEDKKPSAQESDPNMCGAAPASIQQELTVDSEDWDVQESFYSAH
eukprot:gene22597-29737_t